MIAAVAAAKLEDLTLEVREELHVKAPLDVTFESLLEQLGPLMTQAEMRPMPMKIEAWPGGRWYRDLGNGNGHYWGTVQAIKKPTLLEICGPLMISSAVFSNVQYRLSEENGGTLIKFRHTGFGCIDKEMASGMPQGWTHIIERVRAQAEGKKQ